MNERRARLLMEENGLEALVLSTPENVLYFSGYGSFNQRLFRD
uniref:Creatinase N-terminal domain-containing protein n=1 Tax=Caldiarchaeum subterraneum TaxID=311458 RepID=A0A7J3VUL9_CALS0